MFSVISKSAITPSLSGRIATIEGFVGRLERPAQRLLQSGTVTWRHPAHPHSLALGGGDLVPDPLARYLALELRERQQDVERKSAHRGRRVELLGARNKRNAVRIEHLDHLGEVGERT